MSDFLALIQANGVLGLIVGLVVLLVVFGLSKSGVVVTPNQKRSANVIVSILLAGISLLNPESADVVVGSIASISSALLYELINWFAKRNTAR